MEIIATTLPCLVLLLIIIKLGKIPYLILPYRVFKALVTLIINIVVVIIICLNLNLIIIVVAINTLKAIEK